jgi:tRNA(Ile)-lysidine synthase
MIVEEVRAAVRDGGLFARDRPVVAMLSGGRDSICLLDVAVALLGRAQVSAVHVNYGLRPEADEDQRHCVAVCAERGVELELIRAKRDAPGQPAQTGNVQAWAREQRYAAAERIALRRDALIATGHTASDQVETILYRLAASPGRRALLGMAASDGRLIRPLLSLTREQTTEYCEALGLRWRDDASNEDEGYARTRVRAGLLPALSAVHSAAQANVLRTAALLREETELFEELLERELDGRASIAVARLRELAPALARMVVIRLAEDATGAYVPQAGERVQELLALGRRGGRAELHLGGRAGAVIEDGVLRMVKLPPRA